MCTCMQLSNKARKGCWVPMELEFQVVGSCAAIGRLSSKHPSL